MMGSTRARRRERYEVLAVAFAIVALAALVIATAKVLIVLFAGILFALVLQRIAGWVSHASKLPYGVCIGGVVVLLVAAVMAAVPLLGPQVAEQAGELAKTLPEAARSALQQLSHGPLAPAIGRDLAEKVPTSTTVKSVAQAALGAASLSAEVLAALGVIFFVGVYGSAQPKVYTRAALAIVPGRYRARVERVLAEVAGTLSRWLLGRLVAMSFVGVTTAIAFSALDVPLPIALAIFAGLLTFIEYLGAILSAIPPVLLALTVSPVTALWVLVLFTGIHLVEGYLLSPIIARVAVHFPPGFTIAGQVVLSALVGVLGLTFSTPLLVVAVVSVKTWYARSADTQARVDAGAADER